MKSVNSGYQVVLVIFAGVGALELEGQAYIRLVLVFNPFKCNTHATAPIWPTFGWNNSLGNTKNS